MTNENQEKPLILCKITVKTYSGFLFVHTRHPTIHGICYIGFGKPFSASFSQLESLQNACIYSIAYELTVRGHANCSENEPVHK